MCLFFEQQKNQEGDDEGECKSQAWKAYMAEVRAYEEKTCTDGDGHKRPLVK